MILQVAVNKPLYTHFDYLPPKGVEISKLSPGIRLRVPFGRLKLVGILLAITDSSNVPTDKLKAAEEILDSTPLLSEQNLKLLYWVAHYYHHPIGEVIATSLPSALLKKDVAVEIKKLPESKLIEKTSPLQLNSAQAKVVEQVNNNLEQFYPCLLDGVTGSGKTEVYLQIIQKVLEQGKQALVLVPEINLTPQIIQRFEQACAVPIAVWHSKLTAKQRLNTWLLAREGLVSIIIGTRSAVWIPLSNIGVFIVDEEHDLSYKQQDHFRYSARDVAIVRAQQAGVPILLGTATPSLDTLYNALQKRYEHFVLPERAGCAVHPSFHIVDMRQQGQGLSSQLKSAIKQRLKKRQQVLLFINRRGYAPTLTCYNCGWVATCKHCDANLTYHNNNQRLNCHHCGASHLMYSQCPSCQYLKLSLLGQGTERIEENLEQEYPSARILRIDSDTTSRKNAMQELLNAIHNGEADILIGTQMLAKGHHFPKVTLVGVINIDSGLYGIDFRSTERMAQLLIQVAGRSGRANEAGQVLIQTHHPDNPLLTRLIRKGYNAFAQAALQERQQTEFPPYAHLALLRAEAKTLDLAMEFLSKAKAQAQTNEQVQLLGPVTAPMEKRAAWYRTQLLLQATERKQLHAFLSQWLPRLQALAGSKVRWSLDVDPQDLL